jgi:trimeric autotransporter adhesin
MRSILTGIASSFLVVALGCGGGSNSGTNAPTLTSLQVTAPSSNVIVGQTLQMTAMGTYSDHSTKDLTQSVNWSSSNTTAATASNSGLLSAQSSGSVTVTVSSGLVTGSLSVTIAPKLVSIVVSPVVRP